MFAAIALHPEMVEIVSLSPEEREKINKAAGLIYSRLTIKDCISEVRRAVESKDNKAIHAGFSFLGGLSMQELLANPNVVDGLNSLENYFDSQGLKEALSK